MAKLFAHPQPQEPLPPLPFERNQEVDVPRACRILDTHPPTIHRMLKKKLLSGYPARIGTARSYRIKHASIVEYCDNLRVAFHLPLRKGTAPGMRLPDNQILPFPPSDAISVQDVMEHLDVSGMTVLKLLQSGQLEGYQLLPEKKSPWRISRPSFVAYLRKLQTEAQQKPLSPHPSR